MAHGTGGHSVADITHHLKGIHFPARKQDVVQQAKSNGAKGDIMQVLDGMPDQEYATIAEVMKAIGETGRDPDRS